MPRPSLKTLCLNLGFLPFKPETRYRGQRGPDRQDRTVAFRLRLALAGEEMRARAIQERQTWKTAWMGNSARLAALEAAERELYGEPGEIEREVYGC
jgi:hypothetical protein